MNDVSTGQPNVRELQFTIEEMRNARNLAMDDAVRARAVARVVQEQLQAVVKEMRKMKMEEGLRKSADAPANDADAPTLQ